MLALRREHLAKFQSLMALALLLLVISLLEPDSFLTRENGLNILRQISINLCLSIGMTLIILTAGIDLSVGSVLALTGAVAAGLLKHGVPIEPLGVELQFTVYGAVVAALLTGAAAGIFNGVAVTCFRLPSFVATLGMLSIARGLTKLWTAGNPITGLGPKFGAIGTGVMLGIPIPVWLAGGLVGVFVLLTRMTRFGRHIYAVGGNERAALLTGLPVTRIKIAVYALGGMLAGAAGLIQTARLDSATPNAGLGYELDSIAAVVIGGTSLSGGRGSVMGTVIGCLIIGVLNNGLFLLNVSPFWQQVVKGFVILAAVAIDRMSQRES